MELDLTPKKAQPLFEGDGGAYYLWSSSEVPLLAKNNVGAGLFVLQPQGFALPHYADSSKIGFVIQGTDGIVGMVLANTTKEVVLKLKKGDVIPIPLGAISWWFNNGDSELVIAFLGETSQAHVFGQFTYFLLTGTQGLIGGFSSEVTTKAYNLTNDEANKLTKSQKGVLIHKLEKGLAMPAPQMNKTKEMVHNIDSIKPDHVVKNGGSITTLSESKFPFVGEVGLSVIKVRLEPNAMKSPSYPANPAVQLIYVARGSGKTEIVGLNGKLELDSQVEAGQLLVVSKFFAVTLIASEEGLECYSILTTKKPVFEELAGESSIWKAISPLVQQVAFNVDSHFEKLFLSKIKDRAHPFRWIPPHPTIFKRQARGQAEKSCLFS